MKQNRTREYRSWSNARQRCFDSNLPNFQRYGGRGITMAPEWADFAVFLLDVGPCPSPSHSLDRYPDNDGPYAPGNVRWATPTEQSRNTRSNRLITFDGITRCLAAWAEHIGTTADILRGRLTRGWPLDKALNPAPPVRKKSSQYKGVAWDSARRTWTAGVKRNGRTVNLGRFANETDAAHAYIAATAGLRQGRP